MPIRVVWEGGGTSSIKSQSRYDSFHLCQVQVKREIHPLFMLALHSEKDTLIPRIFRPFNIKIG